MRAAIETRMHDYPAEAMKEGARDCHAFSLHYDATHLGVLYASEPYKDAGVHGLHISISKSIEGVPVMVEESDVQDVQGALAKWRMAWPDKYDTERFQVGPFAHRGLHIWEL